MNKTKTGDLEAIQKLVQKGFEEKDRLNQALLHFDEILKKDANNIKALNNKGATLVKMDRNEEAILEYNKILSIEPKNIFALNGKAVALNHLEEYKKALSFINKIFRQKKELASLNEKILESIKNFKKLLEKKI